MGEGFFALGTPVGRDIPNPTLTYTRDGSFQLDRLGNLVNTEGLPLLGEGQQKINIPFFKAVNTTDQNGNTTSENSMLTEIAVKDDGRIEATYGLDTTELAGKIILADFVNEHGLQNIGNAKFQETKCY